MTEILFNLNGIQTIIQCVGEEKMKEIFKRYASKIQADLNSIYFIYGGNKVNEELSLNEINNQMNNNEERINILVFEKNDGLNKDN